MSEPDLPTSAFQTNISALLTRPAEQRAREFKYRCAQSIVFGLPVLALQWIGPRLGGPEAARWIGILQALLCGWIVYVAAAGRLIEGLVARTRRFVPDTLVALLACGMYLYSAVCVIPIFIVGHTLHAPLLFHIVVLLLIPWTGLRCWQLRTAGQ
jgi:cation transport ATPase